MRYPREDSPKRPVAERVGDWRDLYVKTSPERIRTQATRCMDCGVPFCQSSTGCPVENVIPDWNTLVSEDRWSEALHSLHSTNNFPEFTGKLCPAPCESACVLGINADPVSIQNVEWSIIERGFAEGEVRPIPAKRMTGKRVAIVGSGPAGLAAAQQLARAGHSVTVFEKADEIGGLLRYGIPDFKFEKGLIDRRIGQLQAEGVHFKTRHSIGTAMPLARLSADFDAVALAVGAERPRDLMLPGREHSGIYFAMDYLTDQNRRLKKLPSLGSSIEATGKRVVILGGGDTGSDCLGTAIRQGAKSVHQFEIMPMPGKNRDASTPWPHWPLQLRTSHAHEEGGERRWNIATTAFLGDPSGKIRALKAVEVRRVGEEFEPIAGTEFEWAADLVLLALGFSGVREGSWNVAAGLSLNSSGTIAIDSEYRTNLKGVFAAGDATRGASLIVWAIADGRKMAASISRFLEKA